jgi:hypothetical protein
MHFAIFLENFSFIFQFLIQIWKHVKFSLIRFFLFKRPVPGRTRPVYRSYRSVYRWEPIELGFWFEIWISPVSTGFRTNRTGKPVPDPTGSSRPVGIKNPAPKFKSWSQRLVPLHLQNQLAYLSHEILFSIMEVLLISILLHRGDTKSWQSHELPAKMVRLRTIVFCGLWKRKG